MKKFISLFLVFSILALSGGLFANENKYEFSLVKKKTEFPKEKLEFVTIKRDYLLSPEQTLLITPSEYKKVNLNFSKKEDFWQGAKIGALIGGLAMLVFVVGSCGESKESKEPAGSWGNFSFDWEPSCQFTVLAVGVGVVLGGLLGGITATRIKRYY